jgi:phosphate-selective porin OprO and OprP
VIDRGDRSAGTNPKFGGYYIQGSWVVTGESRRYNLYNGAFQAPRPFSPLAWPFGIGAWELAVRYSHTDLNYKQGDDGTPGSLFAVRGGEQDIWTLGVNWYLNANVRLSFNWLHIDVDRLNPAGPGNAAPFGPAPNTPPVGVQIGQKLNAFAMETQFAF